MSSVLSVTGTPARWRRASGCAATDGDDAGLDVGGRAQVERHVAGDQLAAQLRVVHGARAVGDPLRVHRERTADLRGAAPFPGMDGDPQPARPGGVERGRVGQGIREGRLGAGQVPAGQALVAEASRRLGEPHVRLGIVRAQRGADQPDDGPGPRGGLARTRAHGRDPLVQR